MAKAKRKTEPVPQPPRLPQPGDNMRHRQLLPPLPVKHEAVVRDARGQVRDWRLFDSRQDANRYARQRAALPGRKRVAEIGVLIVSTPARQKPAETVAESRVRLNRVSQDRYMIEALDAMPPAAPAAPKLTPAETEQWRSLRDRVRAARAAL